MTSSPQGRDGSPSVAALAVAVSGLRRDVKSLDGKVEVLTGTQQEHAAALDDIADLRRQVEHILAVLTDEDDASAADWFWLTMNEQERSEKISELTDWVETVLRTQYPDYLADQIRSCWPNHPEARWELAWLYQLWSIAYLTSRPAPKETADWHDRWFPGVIRRLTQVMRRCGGTCQREPGSKGSGEARRPVSLTASQDQ